MLSPVKTTEARGTSRQLKIIFFTLNNSGTYSDKIILFMLWILDTISEFLVQEYIPEFEAMNNEDHPDFQQQKEDGN